MKQGSGHEEKFRPVYNELRQQILSLHLPPGTTLRAPELAERHGVSVTPVREALLRLRQEALVDIRPQSRTSVSRISLSSLKGAYVLRLALETEVTNSLARGADPDILAAARGAVNRHADAASRGRDQACRDAGRSFHAALFHAAGFGGLSNLMERRSAPLRRIEPLLDAPAEEDVVQAHDDILRNISWGDEDRATDIMRLHIDRATDGVAAVARNLPGYFVP